MEDSDNEDKILNIKKKRVQEISVFSNGFDKSNNKNDKSASVTPKRTRNTPISSSTSSKSIVTDDILQCVTPKRTRKSIKRFGELVDSTEIISPNTPSKNKCTRKTSMSLCTPIKATNRVDISDCTTPKRTKRTSVSSFTPSKSDNAVNLLESVTPKRIRKSVNRFGESVDWNEIEITNKITENNKKNDKNPTENEDIDFEFDVWRTPVNKHLRRSVTPTTRSGSKMRRSILQNIPENKEIKVVFSPKTPKKTPKAHVKNLTASASRRLDSGARVPCSPIEKARANLHLNAAPKHLPCREVEFKSIHSFLSRKINDELTGSMYISGVPGTGKTATVKRVIDSLNCDLLMKHSFKFIEINGLRLANPHQAFSVIWKGLTAETVSSSRAQTLLNDYFSGKEVRELSTVLLVDEVDHICNRKQDVVYNILDWPSRTGSKVVVITIANTMDLPERVLRGCVTSRMGLTRLVFKPYTFQQLQEIIMNRLVGNSLFDPDAVQLVARKVAAISGDARRALDICRRAIDLIKCEETEFVTINLVNKVINSILSGVRVTAIRNCSLLEQFFLRALRDETTRTGFDYSTIDSVYIQMKTICLFEGEELPNDQQVIMMAYRLRDSGLIFLEKKRWDIFRKVSLNVSPEDISYALENNNIEVNR